MRGDVSVFFDDGRTLVRLSGEVSQVTFIDSVGLAFISRLVAAEFQLDRRVRVVGATGQVEYLLELTGLRAMLDPSSAEEPLRHRSGAQ